MNGATVNILTNPDMSAIVFDIGTDWGQPFRCQWGSGYQVHLPEATEFKAGLLHVGKPNLCCRRLPCIQKCSSWWSCLPCVRMRHSATWSSHYITGMLCTVQVCRFAPCPSQDHIAMPSSCHYSRLTGAKECGPLCRGLLPRHPSVWPLR